jgi:hypothetical protein
MTPRLLAALDALETANTEVVEARKAEAAIAAPPASAPGIVAGIKHVFSPVNAAAVKSAPAAPPVLPAKTVAAPVKDAPAGTPAAKIPASATRTVQKPASVPQIVTRSHNHRRKTAGM